MVILLRYACLLGLGLASLFAFVNVGSLTGQMVLTSGERALVHPRDIAVWMLGVVALASFLSVFRFAFARVPAMVRSWVRDRKDKIATLSMLGVVCLLFVVI